MAEIEKPGMIVLAGNSHPELTNAIIARLGIRAGECSVQNKPNRETIVDIRQSVRNRHVFILQTGTKDVNNHIMELLIMIYACKTSSSKSITVVMPYLPYSKQCRMRKRSCITAKLLADMIVKAGANKLITMDLYRKEIQGFFNIPVDNLRASPFLVRYIVEQIPDYKNAVIVAKNPGVIIKATSYAERLRIGIAVIHGEAKEAEAEEVDGRGSPPVTDPIWRKVEAEAGTFVMVPPLTAKEKPPLTIVGDVGGHIAIMVDYMIDEVQSFVSAADLLQELGAYKIYVVATHGLLSADAPQLLEDSAIDEVVVTNTVPHDVQKMQCHKIKTVDASVMFSESIRRSFHQESMSYLFRDVAIDD